MANSKHLQILKQGAEVWNRWRDENPKIRPDLSGADLSRMDLGGVYLSDADLSEADLQGTNLRRAQLNRANLRGANLESAELTDADIVHAILVGANLTKANLTSAELQSSDLSDADFSGANLTRGRFFDAMLNRARLVGADLTWANLSGANFQGANLSGAVLKETTLRNAKLYGVDLRDAMLVGTDLEGLDLNQLIISEEARVLIQEERKKKMAPSADPHGDAVAGSLRGYAGCRKPSPAEVHFAAYHPIDLTPRAWQTLLVYAHVPSAAEAVQEDSRSRLLDRLPDYREKRGVATTSFVRGAELTFVPKMRGCRFNPSRVRVIWLEDWHCVEFRVQAAPELWDFEEGTAVNGRLAIYVGPLLVAEVGLGAILSYSVDPQLPNRPHFRAIAKPYEEVFVSYSHEDTHIVEALGRAYEVLGLEYLRDVMTLRSGEKWGSALLTMIDEAHIFQLCWSNAAKRSPFVEREWQHAVSLLRHQFIRPVYWERPMPQPPPELSDIHFAYLEGYASESMKPGQHNDTLTASGGL